MNASFSPPADASANSAAIRGGRSTKVSGQVVHVAPSGNAALLDVQAVAEMLGCSPRHVYRLSDAGRMPVARQARLPRPLVRFVNP